MFARGHVTKVERGPEWAKIFTDNPQATRLDTKKSDLIDLAEQLLRDRVEVEFEFNERDSTNINPHTNRPYVNRYFEGAVALGNAAPPGYEPPAATTTYAPLPEFNRLMNPVDAWRISLAAGGKLAVATLPMMPTAQRSFEVQKQIALAWAEFFFFSNPPGQSSVNGNPSSVFQPPADPQPARSPGAYDEPLGVPAEENPFPPGY